MDSIIFTETWKPGDVFKRALISDAHIQPNRPNVALKKALDRCKNENTKILFNGDIADFIGVKDPRYNKAHDKADMAAIINEQIEWVIDFLFPYADLIELMGIGNHEDVLIKHYGIDPLRFILRDLNKIRESKKLGPIHYGSYRGYILYRFKYKKGARSKTLKIIRHHGSGGSAPVTGGAIDLNRLMTGFDADIYWIGHKHKETQRGEPIVRITDKGNIYTSKRKGIMTPGFQPPIKPDDFNKSGGNCSFEDRFYSVNGDGWGLLEVRPYNLPSGRDMDLDYTLTMIDG